MFRFSIEKLQLPPYASKASPIFSSVWHHSCPKAFYSRLESRSSLPTQPDSDKRQTISYLVTSCGLSSEAALCAAKFVGSKKTEKITTVIQLLRRYGFSDAQIDNIAIKRSHLLVSDPVKNLKPKLDFLVSEGFSVKEVADILGTNISLLARNLERGLIATYRFFSTALQSRSDVVNALKIGNQCLTVDHEPSIKMLRDNGLSEPVILYLLKRFPMTLMRRVEHLEEAVKTLLDMGMDPKSKMFVYALSVLGYLSKETWHRKVKLYQELGWSETEVIHLFKKNPSVFCVADEQIRFKVDFFKKNIGWDQSFISMNPAVLQLSIEKRILPRVSVLKVLMSKGFIEKRWSQSQFYRADKFFFDKYVKKYTTEVPDIIKTYQDTIAFKDN